MRHLSPKSLAFEPFAEAVRVGDRAVLKRARGDQWEIIAIGEVTSEYLHQEVFGDVEGWDLQHCRQVRWKSPNVATVILGLTRGTLRRVINAQTIDTINQIWSSGQDMVSLAIPPEPKSLKVEEVIESLIVDGLPGQSAELIANTIWRLRRMAKYYQEHGADVGEHEIRTFLIVPLLMSWAGQSRESKSNGRTWT